MRCTIKFNTALFIAFFLFPSFAQATVPAQYIAKLYSEALGRAPDYSGWNARVNFFINNPCTVSTLQTQGQAIFNSTEFANIGYSNSAKVLILYRTILDREPDAAGFNVQLNQLNSGASFLSVVNAFYSSPEFNQLSADICSGSPYYFNALGQGSYAIQPPGTPAITEASLQASLNSAGVGGVVTLPSMTVVYLNTTLTIPSGVTLTTAGSPTPAAHGLMARIVRSASYSAGAPLIEIAGGGKLSNIWVDGQRGAAASSGGVPQPFVHSDINIQTLSGTNTSVNSNFIANTAGWSSLQVLGVAEVANTPCQSNQISNNVITVYSSSNSDTTGQSWADGISDSCEGSTVSGNQIIDPSDAGIVLFRSEVQGVGAIQASQVTNNTIVSSGNSAYAAIAVDPLYVTNGCSAMPSFAGSYVGKNVLWSGPNSEFEIGLAVGTSEWFFSSGGCIGTGANVSNNSTNNILTRVNDGIAIQGMLNATVQSNTLLINRVPKGRCKSLDVAAGVSAGIASGSLQPYTDQALEDCI